MRKRRAWILAGIAMVLVAWFLTPLARRPGVPYDLLLFGLIAPVGWVLVWVGVGRLRLGVATYLGMGLLTATMNVIQQGSDAYPNVRNIDAAFWTTYLPVMCWPHVLLWMAGLSPY